MSQEGEGTTSAKYCKVDQMSDCLSSSSEKKKNESTNENTNQPPMENLPDVRLTIKGSQQNELSLGCLPRRGSISSPPSRRWGTMIVIPVQSNGL